MITINLYIVTRIIATLVCGLFLGTGIFILGEHIKGTWGRNIDSLLWSFGIMIVSVIAIIGVWC